ncbi:MAG: hypothetical protein OXB88_08935 [Bacteriovoracales bacterium]|nr:hypothetical protein [Bacteriovoracales bacterium]
MDLSGFVRSCLIALSVTSLCAFSANADSTSDLSHKLTQNFHRWPLKERARFHYHLLKSLEKDALSENKYNRPQKSSTFLQLKYRSSPLKKWIPSLEEILEKILIPPLFAKDRPECIYGGWLSTRNSQGKCLEPWKVPSYTDVGPRYKVCGGKGLVRCNPTIFKPKHCHDPNGCCIKTWGKGEDSYDLTTSCLEWAYGSQGENPYKNLEVLGRHPRSIEARKQRVTNVLLQPNIDPSVILDHLGTLTPEGQPFENTYLPSYLILATSIIRNCTSEKGACERSHCRELISIIENDSDLFNNLERGCGYFVSGLRFGAGIDVLKDFYDQVYQEVLEPLEVQELLSKEIQQIERKKSLMKDPEFNDIGIQGACLPSDLALAQRKPLFQESGNEMSCLTDIRDLEKVTLSQTNWGKLDIDDRAEKVYEKASEAFEALKREGFEPYDEGISFPNLMSCIAYQETAGFLDPIRYNYKICQNIYGKYPPSTAQGLAQIVRKTFISKDLKLIPTHDIFKKNPSLFEDREVLHKALPLSARFQLEAGIQYLDYLSRAWKGDFDQMILGYDSDRKETYLPNIQKCYKCMKGNKSDKKASSCYRKVW